MTMHYMLWTYVAVLFFLKSVICPPIEKDHQLPVASHNATEELFPAELNDIGHDWEPDTYPEKPLKGYVPPEYKKPQVKYPPKDQYLLPKDLYWPPKPPKHPYLPPEPPKHPYLPAEPPKHPYLPPKTPKHPYLLPEPPKQPYLPPEPPKVPYGYPDLPKQTVKPIYYPKPVACLPLKKLPYCGFYFYLMFNSNTDAVASPYSRVDVFNEHNAVSLTYRKYAECKSAAYFNGKNKLIVWALHSMDFHHNFLLKVRFQLDLDYATPGTYAVIDNNCYRYKYGTILVYVKVVSNSHVEVCGQLVVNKKILNNCIKLKPKYYGYYGKYDTGGWIEVELSKKGSTIDIIIDGYRWTDFAAGIIPPRNCNLNIGAGYYKKNFKGWIDYITLSHCHSKPYGYRRYP